MQRIIKFRAWQKQYKTMWYDGGHMDLSLSLDGHLFTPDSYYGADHDKGFVLMQFTGLHDRLGKEIYEGDILAMPYGGHPARWTVGELSEYGLHFHRHTIKPYSSPHHYRDLRHFDKAEIIGNIYEHSELLEH